MNALAEKSQRHGVLLWAVLATSLASGAVACTGPDESQPPRATDSGLPEQPADSGEWPDGGGADGGAEDAGPGEDAGTEPTDAGEEDPSDGGRDFSTDRARFFGNSRCAQADVLLCESFEGDALDTRTWQVVGTAPALDATHVARGARSLHITRSRSGPSYIRETKTFPVPNNTYFGRMFVRFGTLPAPPAMSYAHWTIAAASGTGTVGEIRIGGQMYSGKNWFGVGTDSQGSEGGTGDWTMDDGDPNGHPRPVPLNEWMCIEWMHKGDTNETRFYWDGVEHPSLYTSSAVHGGNDNPYLLPTFDALWIGWNLYQSSSQTFEMWVDEVAIDTQRIGCVL